MQYALKTDTFEMLSIARIHLTTHEHTHTRTVHINYTVSKKPTYKISVIEEWRIRKRRRSNVLCVSVVEKTNENTTHQTTRNTDSPYKCNDAFRLSGKKKSKNRIFCAKNKTQSNLSYVKWTIPLCNSNVNRKKKYRMFWEVDRSGKKIILWFRAVDDRR